tara:strand:+ start:195 stop:515 length:321 start_codon:yes stop_codon:yes gene_type:complete
MINIRKYYSLIILLICVGAFPVAVVSSNDIADHESDICKFHTDQSTNNHIIPCDHCSYYFDMASHADHMNIFMVRKPILLVQNKKEFKHTTKSFFKTSRSPPHSYL